MDENKKLLAEWIAERLSKLSEDDTREVLEEVVDKCGFYEIIVDK